MRYLIFILFFIISLDLLKSSPLTAKKHIVSGVVMDSVTKETLQAVTVLVKGTNIGAITKKNGEFSLKLLPGDYTIIASMIGREPAEIEFTVIDKDLKLEIFSKESSVVLEGISVVAEDPGMSLMRKVIRKKIFLKDSLKTYTYMLYNKLVVSTDTLTAGRTDLPRDTTIFSILESVSKGYYSSPDSYYNEIIQRKQSVNIPNSANFLAFSTSLNAYDEIVNILNEEIYSPFNDNALDYYEFVLEETIDADTADICVVRVTPGSSGRRLFSGYVYINENKLIPLKVELKPNKAVLLPFDASLYYEQEFNEYDGRFVLPSNLRIESSLKAEIFWIIAPRVDILIESRMAEYLCNVPLDDGIFSQRKVESAESAEQYDELLWDQSIVMPLKPEEMNAYEAIRAAYERPDSVSGTGYFDKIFGPVTKFFSTLDRKPFSGWQDIFRFNRIHGAYIGAGIFLSEIGMQSGYANLGYGLSDNKLYYDLNTSIYFDKFDRFGISANIYNKLQRIDNPYIVKDQAITYISLFTGNDYGDYYYNNGIEFGIEYGFGQKRFIRREVFDRISKIRLFAKYESHNTAKTNSRFSLFNWNTNYRQNPVINEGEMATLGLELSYNNSKIRKFFVNGFRFSFESSNPEIINSQFTFDKYDFATFFTLRTLPLWELEVQFNAGLIRGALPLQKIYSFESSVSRIITSAAFRSLDVKEFHGDKYAALLLEHNFGELIPGVLRIPNIASLGIEFIGIFNIGWSDFSLGNKTKVDHESNFTYKSTNSTSDRYFYEAGIGLNRIFLFFRLDLVMRLSQVSSPTFWFTVTGARF